MRGRRAVKHERAQPVESRKRTQIEAIRAVDAQFYARMSIECGAKRFEVAGIEWLRELHAAARLQHVKRGDVQRGAHLADYRRL